MTTDWLNDDNVVKGGTRGNLLLANTDNKQVFPIDSCWRVALVESWFAHELGLKLEDIPVPGLGIFRTADWLEEQFPAVKVERFYYSTINKKGKLVKRILGGKHNWPTWEHFRKSPHLVTCGNQDEEIYHADTIDVDERKHYEYLKKKYPIIISSTNIEDCVDIDKCYKEREGLQYESDMKRERKNWENWSD